MEPRFGTQDSGNGFVVLDRFDRGHNAFGTHTFKTVTEAERCAATCNSLYTMYGSSFIPGYLLMLTYQFIYNDPPKEIVTIQVGELGGFTLDGKAVIPVLVAAYIGAYAAGYPVVADEIVEMVRKLYRGKNKDA